MLAICTVEYRDEINKVFEAMGWGTKVMFRSITSDQVPALNSEITHYAMYNANSSAGDAFLFQKIKEGVLPELDLENQEIGWGENGIMNELSASNAFQNLEFWLNNSEILPLDFANSIMETIGLSFLPEEA